MPVVRPFRLSLAALALLAAACSDSPLQPANQNTDLSSALSEMSLSGLVPASLGSAVPSVPSTSLVPSQCPYSAGSFVCAPVTMGGLTINRSFALLGASGDRQSAFDAATTAAVQTTTATTGTLTSSGLTGAVDEHGTMTLSGLLTGQHVLDGVDVMHLTSTFGGTSSTFNTTTNTAGLLLPARGAGQYPRAGTITMVTSVPGLGSSYDFTMSMTFNGTSMVAVTITDFGSTTHCTMDLTNPEASAHACFGPTI